MNRPRMPSPAVLVAVLALVAALAGTAIAGPDASTSAINKKKVKKIATKQINKLAPELSVASAETANSANTANSATNATRFAGRPLSEFLRYGATIPSGATVTGVWGGREQQAGDANGNGAGAKDDYRFAQTVSFPLPAPANLSDARVNFALSGPITPGDFDLACTGGADNPTAPAGKVCIYADSVSSVSFAVSSAQGFALGSGASTRHGFFVNGPISNGTDADPSGYFIQGTWAYTAP